MIRGTFFFCCICAILFASCDFSTHEYIHYKGRYNKHNARVFIDWSDEGECYLYFGDTVLVFDGVELEFLSDHSTYKAEFQVEYSYWYDDSGKITDSTDFSRFEFDIPKDDPLIGKNDSIILRYYLKNKQVEQDTLRKKITKTEFIDRISIPRFVH